jgi:hypothetical protein
MDDTLESQHQYKPLNAAVSRKIAYAGVLIVSGRGTGAAATLVNSTTREVKR